MHLVKFSSKETDKIMGRQGGKDLGLCPFVVGLCLFTYADIGLVSHIT